MQIGPDSYGQPRRRRYVERYFKPAPLQGYQKTIFSPARCGRSNKYWKNARPRLGRIESPPLEATPASRALGEHALRIYAEIGKKLVVDAVAEGGGTDAAFASLETKAPVLERFGLQGFGAHSNDAEYVAVDSIEPRFYLLTRLIMDMSQGKDSQ